MSQAPRWSDRAVVVVNNLWKDFDSRHWFCMLKGTIKVLRLAFSVKMQLKDIWTDSNIFCSSLLRNYWNNPTNIPTNESINHRLEKMRLKQCLTLHMPRFFFLHCKTSKPELSYKRIVKRIIFWINILVTIELCSLKLSQAWEILTNEIVELQKYSPHQEFSCFAPKFLIEFPRGQS